MDTITQIALGAAVGEFILGRQVGRKALVWGGACGLFLDLDILYPFADAVKTFTYHRSLTHSVFTLIALTPLVVRLIVKLHPQTAVHRARWFLLVWMAFVTHVLLDCLTVYGTQIFWPLKTPPVMWSAIFVVDPAYSLPLLIGVLAAAILSRRTRRGHVINTLFLFISSFYLLWSVGAKLYVTNVARESLKMQNIGYAKLLTIPTPLNTVLWRVLVMDEKGYYEGFYSLFDKTGDVLFSRYPSDNRLLQPLAGYWPVERLRWFTHGFYSVEVRSGGIIITDLRMGLEPNYIFRFKIGELGHPHATPTPSRRLAGEYSMDQLRWVWQRIWTPDLRDVVGLVFKR